MWIFVSSSSRSSCPQGLPWSLPLRLWHGGKGLLIAHPNSSSSRGKGGFYQDMTNQPFSLFVQPPRVSAPLLEQPQSSQLAVPGEQHSSHCQHRR